MYKRDGPSATDSYIIRSSMVLLFNFQLDCASAVSLTKGSCNDKSVIRDVVTSGKQSCRLSVEEGVAHSRN